MALAILVGVPTRSRVVDPRLVVAYVRKSTDEVGLGPEAQRAAIQRWCTTHDKNLVGVHEDLGISGGAPLERRPGLIMALDDLRRRRAGVLLVARRDRLARDTLVAATIERLLERDGARVLVADGSANADGPEGALLRGVLDVFAAFERSVIRRRTKAALAVKKSRGERVGTAPFGFRVAGDGRRLEPDELEQAALAEVDRLRAQGHSIRTIASRLNEAGTPARGARWHPTTVARVLRRRGAP